MFRFTTTSTTWKSLKNRWGFEKRLSTPFSNGIGGGQNSLYFLLRNGGFDVGKYDVAGPQFLADFFKIPAYLLQRKIFDFVDFV
jgi:hypothetical protein